MNAQRQIADLGQADDKENRINSFDFMPLARVIFDSIEKDIAALESEPNHSHTAIKRIAGAVADLQTNGKTFGCTLLSDISSMWLYFLKNSNLAQQDALKIIGIFRQSLRMVLAGRITGDGGMTGRLLMSELTAVRQRYDRKYSMATR